MTLEELRNAVCRHIDENRDAYNETGDECYRAVKEELLHILGLIDTVDHEPAGKDKLTLKELARELRKIFRFKYLTVDSYGDEITLWMDKPVWDGDTWWAGDSGYLLDFYSNRLKGDIDLSEYEDEDGNIDYSKCIVEVNE